MSRIDTTRQLGEENGKEVDVMHVEDDPASAAGFVSQSRLIGIQVDLVDDIAAARTRLETIRYRLFVVDLEVFDQGKRRLGAGLELISDILRGHLGEAHRDTPIIVHTAHLGAFEESGLRDSDQVQLVRKPASVYDRAIEILRPPGEDIVLVEVLPMSRSAAEVEGVLVRVPGWSDAVFEVPMAQFDGAQLIDVALADHELYFSARVNLDATSPGELGFRIITAAPTAEGKIWDA